MTPADTHRQSSKKGDPAGGLRPDERSSVLRALVAAACVVVIIAGLKAAADLVLPFIFALILTAVVYPWVRWFKRKKIPTLASVAIVVVVIGVAMVVQAGMIAALATQFSKALPSYQERLNALAGGGTALLNRFGMSIPDLKLDQSVNPATVMKLVGSLLDSLTAILSQTTLVTLTMAFMLFEVSEFSAKMDKAFGRGQRRLEGVAQGVEAVQRYLIIKTVVSALTGFTMWIGCWIIGLDFAILWGFLAFALNYVPTIGSIVAAVPAVLLALIQLGPLGAVLVAALSLAINFTIGNLLEPRMMGRSLGLSSLVVFLSLIFWGWLWGPLGMLLSVPLTVIVKIMLEYQDETRPLAIILGPAVKAR